jgi:hypothetical protein
VQLVALKKVRTESIRCLRASFERPIEISSLGLSNNLQMAAALADIFDCHHMWTDLIMNAGMWKTDAHWKEARPPPNGHLAKDSDSILLDECDVFQNEPRVQNEVRPSPKGVAWTVLI